MMKKRAFLIILDSAGIGAMPDAAEFGDVGANTIGNVYKVRGKLDVPNMKKLGLFNIPDSGLPATDEPIEGCYGKCAEVSKAKDTTCGHWELAGLPQERAFQVFPQGFPESFMKKFEAAIGRETLYNLPASGTAIINQYGDEHVATGKPIVYTSADSVFQVAMHEDVIPIEEQYRICEIAREMLNEEFLVGRVIARPFVGTSGNYTRTERRKDYAIPPFSDTILDGLAAKGFDTVGIGKIEDIFCNRGITTVDHTRNNPDGIVSTQGFIDRGEGDFIFTNLVDTDMLYGHRNDVEGYGQALEYFDEKLPQMLSALREGDILMISADHGCDPTTPGTDHSLEYIPLLVAGPRVKKGVALGVRSSFADIGATIYEYLTGEPWVAGESFLSEILEESK